MLIGTKIKGIRKEYDLSQEQFAEKYGVTRQTVSNWENNKHYPDMEILKRISDDFEVSFDTLLKDDDLYIRTIDKDRKKLALWKRLLIAFFVVFLGLIVSFFAFFHVAFQGTRDGERITTNTDVKMLVDIKDSSPSNAITKTYDAEIFDNYSETKKNELRGETSGKLEGDVPHVSIENHDDSYIGMRFQNIDYKNLEPIIENVTLYTADGMPVEPLIRTDKKLEYKYENGTIIVFLSDLFKENELTFSESDDALASSGDFEKVKLAVWFCIFEVRYSLGDKEYVSLTSVAL